MDRRIAGVAGGLGEYLGVDATALRVGFVIASVLFLGGIGGPILYVIAWIIIPEEGRDTAVAKTSFSGRPWHDWDRSARSWALVLGALALAATWSFGFWPWWHWGALPVWLVVMALILLALARHRETSWAGGPPTWSRPTGARPTDGGTRPTDGGAPGPSAGPFTAPTGTTTDVTARPASQNGDGGTAGTAGSVDWVGVAGGAGGVDGAGVVSGAGIAGAAGGPVTPAAPGAVASPAGVSFATGGQVATDGPLATDGTVAPVGATATVPGVTGTSGGGAGQPGAATTSALAVAATAQGAVGQVKPSDPTELSEADLAAARTAAAKWAADQLALAGVPTTPNGGSAANGYAPGAPPALSSSARRLRRAVRVLVALIAALVLLTVLTVVGVTLGSGSSLSGGVGDNTYAPVSASAVRSHYRLGAGNLEVNLSQVQFPASGKTVDVTLGIGNLSVEVPQDAVVTVQAHSGIGQVEVFGQTGSDVQATYDGATGPAPEAPHLNLDAHVGMGHLQVTHT